jgi:hypothetical protein
MKMPSKIRTLIAVLIILTIYIGFHEAGHYVMALKLGLHPYISGPLVDGGVLNWIAASVTHVSGGGVSDRKVALAGVWADALFSLFCLFAGCLALRLRRDTLGAFLISVGVAVLFVLVLWGMNPFWTVPGGDCWFIIN